MASTTLNLNTIYGEIARNVAKIDDIETLEKIRVYVAHLLGSKENESLAEPSKTEVLDDLRTACEEYKMYSAGEKELNSFDDVINSL